MRKGERTREKEEKIEELYHVYPTTTDRFILNILLLYVS
jgi:hypothetical protein